MLKNNTVRLVLRRFVFAVLIIFTAVIQNSAGGIFSKYNIGVFLLIPLTVSIAMFEKEFSGMFFGLFAGALWDVSSPVTDGIFALVFAVFALLCGLLTHYLLRNTLKTAFVLSSIFFVLFSGVNMVFNHIVTDFLSIKYYINHFLIPSFIVTALFVPILYFIAFYTEKHLSTSSKSYNLLSVTKK